MADDHLEELRADARYARERYELYKAKAYGQRPTTPARLRELERSYEQAQARLAAALRAKREGENEGTDP